MKSQDFSSGVSSCSAAVFRKCNLIFLGWPERNRKDAKFKSRAIRRFDCMPANDSPCQLGVALWMVRNEWRPCCQRYEWVTRRMHVRARTHSHTLKLNETRKQTRHLRKVVDKIIVKHSVSCAKIPLTREQGVPSPSSPRIHLLFVQCKKDPRKYRTSISLYRK